MIGKIKPSHATPRVVRVRNQFGEHDLNVRKPDVLCVPSFKQIISPPTTTTTTSSTTTTTCPPSALCPNLPGPCVGTVPNGMLEAGECCDDANLVDCDACHNDCTINTGCGDCHLCPPEQCDPPPGTCIPPQTCNPATCLCQ